MDTSLHPAVDGLALALVEELNPSEAVLFPAASEAFWAAGGRLPEVRASGGLDFDLGPTVAQALAPVALAVGGYALKALADAIAQLMTESAKLAARDAYGALLRRLGAAPQGPAEARVALPASALSQLEAQIAKEARRHLGTERADRLARSVVARIAMPAPGG